MKPIVSALAAFLAFSVISWAQISSQQNVGQSILAAIKENTNLYTDMILGAGLKDTERADFKSSTMLTIIPSYKISEQTSLGLRLTMEKELTGERDFSPTTTYLSVHQKIAQLGGNDFIVISTTGRAYLPLDEDRRKNTSFRGAFYLRPQITFNFSKQGLPSFKYTFRPSYSENLHHFETFNGVVNNQRTLAIISLLEVQMTEQTSWNTLFGTNERWNYQKGHSETYVFDSSIQWNLLKKSYMAVGYSIETATKTVTGENKIKFYDNENGSAYVKLAHLF